MPETPKTTKTTPMKELKRLRLENAQITDDGLSYQEIAVILNIPVFEVKKIEIDALRKLQKPTESNKKLHEYWNITLRPEELLEDMEGLK